MIELVEVEKRYSAHVVLNNISTRFLAGKTHVLLGQSGCGKSTILRLIIGLESADNGDVFVDSKNVSLISRSEVSGYFGYVIQDKTLMPHLTVLDNILLPVRARNITTESVMKHYNFLKELVELDETLEVKYPSQLSGGQKQKACLVRALILNPPYLLMDEPFSALDPMIRSALQVELKKIFEELKKTVIFVTHDLNEASFLGDEITLLNDGKIIQKGQIQELKSNPGSKFVKSFFDAQSQQF